MKMSKATLIKKYEGVYENFVVENDTLLAQRVDENWDTDRDFYVLEKNIGASK